MSESFEKIVKMIEGLNRTAAIAEWIQGFYPEKDVPVLVGGSAVELYTGGAYTTGDLDFVGHVPSAVRKALNEDGFVKHGKNWIHEGGKIFLEFPSHSLGEGERRSTILVGNYRVVIVSLEDLIVDRLAAWKHWESPIDGVNAFLLYQIQHDHLDEAHLAGRARMEEVMDSLGSVKTLHRKYQDDLPPNEELEKWSAQVK